MNAPFSALAANRTILDAGCTLSSSERLVALALIRCADDGGVAWPGMNLLAKMTGLSRSTIARSVASLESSRGPLRIRHEQQLVAGRAEKDSNRYFLTVVGSATKRPRSATKTLGSPTVTRGVVPQRDGGSPTVTQDLPNDLPKGTAQGESHAQEPPARSRKKKTDPRSKKSSSGHQTPLPADFALDESIFEFSKSEMGFSRSRVDAERVKFRLHYEGTGESRADWRAVFKAWLVRAKEYDARDAKKSSGKSLRLVQQPAKDGEYKWEDHLPPQSKEAF
jgi:hypothetical protein